MFRLSSPSSDVPEEALEGRCLVDLCHHHIMIPCVGPCSAGDGTQPLTNEDGAVWITFNGEIYGFAALARQLERRGHRLRTRCDTEVIVHLYEEHGEAFIEHLRGEFAFALYDQRHHTLWLGRDRFGVKPLYYALSPRSLLFGS